MCLILKYTGTCYLFLTLYFKEHHFLIIRGGNNKPTLVNFGDHSGKRSLQNYLTNNNTHDIGFQFTEDEIKQFKIWPQGSIFYFIDDFSFDKVLRDKLRMFFAAVSDQTQLQFIELPQPPDDDSTRWVLFVNRRGQLDCVDYTYKDFTTEGVQRVVLGYDCVGASGGGLAATVLALAGVPPQHRAPNRDEYIEVLQGNIIPDKKHLFEALPKEEWLFHDLSYDFTSAGHYGLYKYTKNGAATIKVKDNISIPVGDVEGLSTIDIIKIKMMYSYIRGTGKTKFSKCSELYQPAANFETFQPDDKKIIPNKLVYHIDTKKQEENNNAGDKTKLLDVIESSHDYDDRTISKLAKKRQKDREKLMTSKLSAKSDYNTDK